MSKIVELINNNNCEFLGKVDLNDINEAQKSLNIKFSNELIEYISNFGAICYKANEINGLGTDSYLNIVKSTLKARTIIKEFPSQCLVLEDTGIHDVKILIDDQNHIFEWQAGNYKKIYESLYDFFNNEIFI